MFSKIVHLFRFIYIPISRSKLVFYITKKPFQSDLKYIKNKFKKVFGYELDLDNPQNFNEKLQWIKLYDRKPIYTNMVDKILAKEYAASIIGEEYIVPTLKVWNKVKEIDFDSLPEQFVMKCNHNSGSGMYICKDKSLLNKKEVKKNLKIGLKRNDFYVNREWPYKNVKRKIFIEELMTDENVPKDQNEGLIDYKFYCFNGEPEFLYIGFANMVNNKKHDYLSFYNLDFTPADFGRSDHEKIPFEIKKPENYEKMIEIARKLAQNTLFVRIDLYNLSGKIKFSECTFFPGGGMAAFEPEEANLKIGQMIKLP